MKFQLDTTLVPARAACSSSLPARRHYPVDIRPGMIFVLAWQVKVKNARNCSKSV
jgi:hypothetical protein